MYGTSSFSEVLLLSLLLLLLRIVCILAVPRRAE
jgi:hypothetical protein